MENKITVYTLCWNELPILPFVIEYWKTYARKVVVYDNNSTDGSADYLRTFDWIEVREYDSNKYDPNAILKIKNACAREADGPSMVCDIDEVLMPESIPADWTDASAMRCEMYECMLSKLPVPISGKLAHLAYGSICARNVARDKTLLFDPEKYRPEWTKFTQQ